MGTLLALLFAGLMTWTFAYPALMAAFHLFGASYAWTGVAALFAGTFLSVSGILSVAAGAFVLSGGGLWTASLVRWVIGKLAYLALLALSAFLVLSVAAGWFGLPLWTWLFEPQIYLLPMLQPAAPRDVHLAAGLRAGALACVVTATLEGPRILRPIVARVTLPLRRLWRALKSGVGGSAAFDGLLDEWLMPWKPGQIIIGTSLYEPGQRLGRTDDRHYLTIATTRAGKGTSAIVPNLLTYPGPALVIDPKGENAAITARARMRMGQDVHILDPFEQLTGEVASGRFGFDPAAWPVRRFNPLSAIRLDDIDVVEQIVNVTEALIVRSEHANPFFDNASDTILKGIIAHVLTWPGLTDAERHLGTVRDYVTGINKRDFLKDAKGHPGAANLAAIAAGEMERAAASGSDVLSTLATHTQWLDSLAVRKAFTGSDFSLVDLKQTNATLYLVIPTDYMEQHSRFLRLFVTLAIRAAGRGVKGRHPMLFILDEFAQLGPLKAVERAMGLSAGGGVRLWPIVQNLTQLEMYGRNWETFIGNASQIQFFASNDQATARYFAERLGHHISWRKVKAGPRTEWVPQSPTWLRTSVELARESSRDSGKALMFFEGGTAAVVRRSPYFQIFKREEYDPNPYEQARRTRFEVAVELAWTAAVTALERRGVKISEEWRKAYRWFTARGRAEMDEEVRASYRQEPPPQPPPASEPPPAPPPAGPAPPPFDVDAMLRDWQQAKVTITPKASPGTMPNSGAAKPPAGDSPVPGLDPSDPMAAFEAWRGEWSDARALYDAGSGIPADEAAGKKPKAPPRKRKPRKPRSLQ